MQSGFPALFLRKIELFNRVFPQFGLSGEMAGGWISSSRARFVRADFEFLTSLLDPGGSDHLQRLWEDEKSLVAVLDLKEVLRGLLESTAALGVSPHFYFYVLVRHAFLDAGIGDEALADYVAGVLADRVRSSTGDPMADVAGGFRHASDFLSILGTAHGRLRFHIQVAAGNQFLVLAGMYPGYLEHRAERCGAPGLEFYESFARQSFRGASGNPQAPPGAMRLFGELAESLPQARRSLNRVAGEFVFMGE